MSRHTQPAHLIAFARPGKPAVWTVAYRDAGTPRRWSTGIPVAGAAEQAKAEAAFAQWQKDRTRAHRPTGSGDPATVKVADVIADYVQHRREKVVAEERLLLAARPLAYFFRDDTMATLMPARVEAYQKWRRQNGVRVVNKRTVEIEVVKLDKPISDNTLIRELGGVLVPAISHAIGYTHRLQAGQYTIPRPDKPAGRDRWLTQGEAARLLRESRHVWRSRLHLPLYILIGLYTGQRRGAILDLKWTQVDFINGRIDFNPPGRQQTKKHRPVIAVPRQLLAMLRRAHKRASCEYVIAYNGQRVLNIKHGFATACERAGLGGIGTHVLRHTAGTWMAQAGVPLFQIAGYIGHSDARTTELYSHHHPDYQKGAVAALERRRRATG